ncbi:hypothetical protein O6H91_02G142500 [Diphasiastrum complanatum]|uniref:Uncharacterized protein n=5 Tax=Diphasiastrum complanatum TaxID=34168 RepID=A0ACC2ELJ2_DIPCM|nr:hypothetical protein O6H91_02G142500 [Diphasiastrum complanatum]KAJ7567322.1 hypothetical protein O6H91_02G142500 [Diphasiastrum complanatum]KAJ7567324.1 hypothetical protein O6H91_02G142500 [Diphasiastrum complanatum]KAJ7567326.1 hypothetical protein O6H91_02G142500 [Diphasiastrum complanatum]KAJ7567327.1 hypothetical protein O6H91_02G142500 [Diphasiastrum complanatum]
MPGSVKVSVLEAEHLPSTVKDGDLVSVRVSVGKREYQTKPSQAFGGRTTSWKYEFSYPVTNLRDNLVIAAIDSKEEIITKSEIQTTSIIQKGFWDTFFSFKGGGRLHLKLCFVLSDEERKKIELMRLEALRRKGLQNLLYRSTYQVPKPVPVRPTKSFVSGVTITEISADSCLYDKDNENKENYAGNKSLRWCPKLLEAPKEKKSLDILNGSDTAVVPFSPHLDDSQAKANLPEVPSFQKLLPPASCEQIEKKCFKTKEDLTKGHVTPLPANSNESSLLLPEASAFMNDLVPSTVVSGFDRSHSPQCNLVPVETLCDTAAAIAVATTGSAPMSASDVCISTSEIQPSMKLITDLAPFSKESSPVTHTLSPLASEKPVVNLQSAEDPSNVQSPTRTKTEYDIAIPEATQLTDTTGMLSDELTIKKSEDIMSRSASTWSTCSSLSLMEEMKPCPCTLQDTSTEQAHIGDANGMQDVSETLLDAVSGTASSEKMQAVGQVECVVVKDAAKKLELEKEAEDGRRATSAVENIKVFKNLPWKSQVKGASEKSGWSVNKKRRTDNERNVLTAETDQFMETADSTKTNVITEIEASNKSVCGWTSTRLEAVVDAADKDTDAKNGFFCISGRMKKWVSVALVLAGVIILGCDAIQRDLASKKDGYCTGKQGDKSCSITSTQMDDQNIVKSSYIYPGQRIQLY